jgi:hypothetical protein
VAGRPKRQIRMGMSGQGNEARIPRVRWIVARADGTRIATSAIGRLTASLLTSERTGCYSQM